MVSKVQVSGSYYEVRWIITFEGCDNLANGRAVVNITRIDKIIVSDAQPHVHLTTTIIFAAVQELMQLFYFHRK